MSAGSGDAPDRAAVAGDRATEIALLVATFIIAVCGLVYELIAGTVSSYLLGDSVYHFSLVIGLFMTAMGLGAWLSRYVEMPERSFVSAQIALALAGGFSAPLLFAAFALVENYSAFLFLSCVLIGALVGLEIPLIIRILEGRSALKVTISNVLTADYVGALAAALLFPLVLVPQLGLMGASLLFGAMNLGVAAMALWVLRSACGPRHWLALMAAGVALAVGAVGAESTQGALERRLYANEIVLAEDTPYQRIVLTRSGSRYQLFLNGSIQFDTLDEYRYHEALVHPAMTRAPRLAEVVIFGGGDGMATREVLRYPEVGRVTLVDIDPAVTTLFRDHPALSALNGGALADPRVEIVNADAWEFLKTGTRQFDVAILDLPDPKDINISKLYTRAFYADLASRLSAEGVIVTQATSPLYARKAFWTVVATLEATPAPASLDRMLEARPYHAHVPSFGEWGFVLAGGRLRETPLRPAPEGLRFYSAADEAGFWNFTSDTSRINLKANTLINQTLPRFYAEGWEAWFR